MAAVLWKVFLWVRTIPPNSIHAYLFKTKKKTQLSSDWTAFPDDFSFRDPDVFSDKSNFPAKAAQQMHLEDDTEQKAFVVANTRSQPMWTGNSAGIWRGARQQYTHIRGQPSMHRDVRKHCARSRHIGVRKYYVQELVVDKLVKLMPCGTTEMVADALTKSLPYSPFRTHRNTMIDATLLRASV